MAKAKPNDDERATTRPLPPVDDSYWAASRRPLESLVFVAPWLILYEMGALVAGPHALRNGADVLLRWLLDRIGLGQYFLLPLLTVGGLLAWHYLRHEPWRVRGWVLCGMAVESVGWAVCLLLLARLPRLLLSVGPFTLAAGGEPTGFLGQLTLYLGAGFYEETLFRLLLLPLTAGVLQTFRVPQEKSFGIAVIVTSLIFSACHYVGAHGDAFTLQSFVFRFLAGVFFAGLFVYRGFGIAVGTHALYDIIAGFRLL